MTVAAALKESVSPRKNALWAEGWGTESTAVPGSDFTYRSPLGHLLCAVTSYGPSPEDFQQLCAQPIAKRGKNTSIGRSCGMCAMHVPLQFKAWMKYSASLTLLFMGLAQQRENPVPLESGLCVKAAFWVTDFITVHLVSRLQLRHVSLWGTEYVVSGEPDTDVPVTYNQSSIKSNFY